MPGHFYGLEQYADCAKINERNGGLAQLGERTLHRGDVAGSSPVASTQMIRKCCMNCGIFLSVRSCGFQFEKSPNLHSGPVFIDDQRTF